MSLQFINKIIITTILTCSISIIDLNSNIKLVKSNNIFLTENSQSKIKNIEKIARDITIKIKSGYKQGSGVIIGKKGNLYTVLTNRHVLIENQPISIETVDGKENTATLITGLNVSGLDVALLQFNSNKNYQVAELDNYNKLTENDTIFAAGFPYKNNQFTFVTGKLQLLSDRAFKDGYQLGYDLDYRQEIEKGMSGGPILTNEGKLIGINGIHANAVTILYNPFIYQDGTQPTQLQIDRYSRYNWGIPITSVAENIPDYLSLNINVRAINSLEKTELLVYDEIKIEAKQITVRLELRSEGTRGSGVIVAQNNNTYYVLTAYHVVEEITALRDLEIVTSDGKGHSANNQNIIRFKGADLALVEFNSDNQYEIATIATHQANKKDGNFTFVAGFPADNPEQFNFSAGSIFEEEEAEANKVGDTANLTRSFDMVYTNITTGGMSGGPVLDVRGHLVGIHGRVEGEELIQQATGQKEKVFLGYSFGIPINVFISRLQVCLPNNFSSFFATLTPSQTKLTTDECTKFKKTSLSENSLQLYRLPLPEITSQERKKILNTIPQPIEPTNKNNPIDWLNYGNQLWRQNNYQDAINAFNKALNLEPDLYLAWYAKAQAYFNNSQYNLALESIEKAIAPLSSQDQPNSNSSRKEKEGFAVAWNLKGRILNSLEQYEEAILAFNKAIELSKTKPEQQFSAYMWRGFALAELKRYEEAVKSYGKALEVRDNSWAYNNRGIAYENLGKYPEAIADYTKAIEINPDYALAYNNRGIIYDILKKYPEAIADYTKAIEINPSYAFAYNNRGAAFRNLEKYSEAIADYTKAIEINPSYADAYNNRGAAFRNLEKYSEAIADYTKAIKINPDLLQAYYNRGIIYSNLEKYSEAIADYTKAIKIDVHLAQAYYNRGIAYYNLEKYSEAIADYTKAIELDPKDINCYLNRGFVYHKEKQYLQALADYELYIKEYPNTASVIINIGLIKYEMGEIEQGMQQWQKALNIDTNLTEVKLALAVAYYQQGKQEQALKIVSDLEIDQRFTDKKFLSKFFWGDKLIEDSLKLLADVTQN